MPPEHGKTCEVGATGTALMMWKPLTAHSNPANLVEYDKPVPMVRYRVNNGAEEIASKNT